MQIAAVFVLVGERQLMLGLFLFPENWTRINAEGVMRIAAVFVLVGEHQLMLGLYLFPENWMRINAD